MINEISITNFQSHKDTKLELDKGVNCITGSSNSGKTSVLRALYWLVYNRPGGTPFASHWILEDEKLKKDIFVSITKDNKYMSRLRSKDVNEYYFVPIGDETIDFKGDTFKALRSEVPEEIKQVLNLSDVNIQKQMDAPFLLSDSAGEVARFLNKIVKLDIIDVMLKSVESKKRKNRTDISNAEEDTERLKDNLEDYVWIDEAEKLVNRLECIEIKSEKYKAEEKSLNDDCFVYNFTIDELNKTKNIDECFKLIDKIEELFKKQERKQGVKDYFLETYAKYYKCKIDMKQTKHLKEAEKLVVEIEKSDEYYYIQSDFRNKLFGEIKQIKLLTNEDVFLKKEIEILEKQLPDICPICGGRV